MTIADPVLPNLNTTLSALENVNRTKNALGWKAYRGHVDAIIAGKHVSPEALSDVMEKLGLKSDDLKAHIAAITREASAVEAESKSAEATAALQELQPKIIEWQARRKAIVEAIDDEGHPLLCKHHELENFVVNNTYRAALVGEQVGKFPELFGKEPAAPIPFVEKTPHEIQQENADTSDCWTAQSVASGLSAVPDEAQAARNVHAPFKPLLVRAHERGWIKLSPTHLAVLSEPAPAGPVRGDDGRFQKTSEE